MKRVFLLDDDDSIALQRLGAALVLQWATVPPGIQETIIQQALALDWTTNPEAAAHRIRALVLQGGADPAGAE